MWKRPFQSDTFPRLFVIISLNLYLFGCHFKLILNINNEARFYLVNNNWGNNKHWAMLVKQISVLRAQFLQTMSLYFCSFLKSGFYSIEEMCPIKRNKRNELSSSFSKKSVPDAISGIFILKTINYLQWVYSILNGSLRNYYFS